MNVRLRVLRAFKELHKARLAVFKGDAQALDEGRQKINEEFRKNLKESDSAKIQELIQVAEDSSTILRKHVIQFEEVAESTFRANITPDTYKLDNSPFREVSEEELLSASRKRKARCRVKAEKDTTR